VSSIRITYYLRPYLADYLAHHYGIHTEPLPPGVRTDDSSLPLWMRCTIGGPRPGREQLEAHKVGRVPYTILITPRRARRTGRFVTLRGQRDFERLVYQQFMAQLATHIRAHRYHGVQVIACIIDFMINNGISHDHIDADDLRRQVDRILKRRPIAPSGPASNAPAPAPSAT